MLREFSFKIEKKFSALVFRFLLNNKCKINFKKPPVSDNSSSLAVNQRNATNFILRVFTCTWFIAVVLFSQET